MPNPPPSSCIGKYQIVDLVGEGAMGSVYRALDPVLNRRVAVKVMSDAIARDGELRDRFMREAQAAGSLQHPNVVTIFDFGEFEGHLYIAMEFVEGVDLEQFLANSRSLSLDQKLGIAIDVLLGLSYAHKRGVVHRDIKPANIRVCEDGRAKIMDFGVAHLDSSKMTRTGVMMGTPNYMAPEQVTGQKVTPATDIFSLGAVLYEVLVGKKAFGADSLHSVLFKVVSADPPPLAIAAPDVPRELDAIIQRALAKEPEHRFQDAVEMANQLTSVRARIAGRAPSESLSLSATLAPQVRRAQAPPDPAKRVVRQRKRTFGVAVVAAVALVAGTWGYTRVMWSPAAPTPEIAAPAPAAGDPIPAPSATVPDDARTATPPAGIPDRETAIVREVRRGALAERARAVDAGAPAASLRVGDAILADADRSLAAGKPAQAVQALNGATAAWRDAVLAIARPSNGSSAPTQAVAPAESAQRPADPPPTVTREPESAPVRREAESAPPPERRSDTAAAPSASTSARADAAREVPALVSAWASALESRDIARLRALYPSITAQQVERFDQFFRAVKSLDAALVPGAIEVNGNAASTRVTGTYQFVDMAGKTQRQPVSFTAAMHRDGTEWRIRSIQ